MRMSKFRIELLCVFDEASQVYVFRRRILHSNCSNETDHVIIKALLYNNVRYLFYLSQNSEPTDCSYNPTGLMRIKLGYASI